MEEYIEEALQQGYIHPSTSPAASSFFFVAKKDGGLRFFYRLPGSNQNPRQIQVSTSPRPICTRTATRSQDRH